MNISRFAVRRPVTICMVFSTIAVLGWISFQRLAVDQLPDVALPSITVSTTYEGAGPAQLALAILADHFGDDQKALAHYEPFMRDVIAVLDNAWRLTSADIDAALSGPRAASA